MQAQIARMWSDLPLPLREILNSIPGSMKLTPIQAVIHREKQIFFKAVGPFGSKAVQDILVKIYPEIVNCTEVAGWQA